jgi:hypothetical protein
MIKRFGLILSSSLFKLTLVAFALTTAGWVVFGTPSHIKQSLEETNAYQSLTNSLLDSASQNADIPQKYLPENNDAVQQAAKSALPEDDIKQYGNTIIDGIYGWLQGNTKEPEFSIDLSKAKARFADNMSTYAQNRYEKLPACSFDQLRAMSPDQDPLSIECRIPGITASAVSDKVKQSILADNQFLPDTTFEASDLPKDANGEAVSDQLNMLPDMYRLLKWMPYVLGVVAILLAIAIIYLSKTKLLALKSIGITLVGTGVFLGISTWLIDWSFRQMNTGSHKPLESSLLSGLKELVSSYNAVLFKFAIGYSAVGIIILFSLWYKNRRSSTSLPTDNKSPESETR